MARIRAAVPLSGSSTSWQETTHKYVHLDVSIEPDGRKDTTHFFVMSLGGVTAPWEGHNAAQKPLTSTGHPTLGLSHATSGGRLQCLGGDGVGPAPPASLNPQPLRAEGEHHTGSTRQGHGTAQGGTA